jgi:hypothetical protein
MNRTRNKIIGTLAAAVAVAALAPTAVMAQSSGDPNQRTTTELGQAVGEPAQQDSAATALYSRTPTELGQRVGLSGTSTVESSGFDWGDAGIGAGVVVALALVALGGVAIVSRRTRVGGSSSPAVSS